jgi:hypothetical protein
MGRKSCQPANVWCLHFKLFNNKDSRNPYAAGIKVQNSSIMVEMPVEHKTTDYIPIKCLHFGKTFAQKKVVSIVFIMECNTLTVHRP